MCYVCVFSLIKCIFSKRLFPVACLWDWLISFLQQKRKGREQDGAGGAADCVQVVPECCSLTRSKWSRSTLTGSERRRHIRQLPIFKYITPIWSSSLQKITFQNFSNCKQTCWSVLLFLKNPQGKPQKIKKDTPSPAWACCRAARLWPPGSSCPPALWACTWWRGDPSRTFSHNLPLEKEQKGRVR